MVYTDNNQSSTKKQNWHTVFKNLLCCSLMERVIPLTISNRWHFPVGPRCWQHLKYKRGISTPEATFSLVRSQRLQFFVVMCIIKILRFITPSLTAQYFFCTLFWIITFLSYWQMKFWSLIIRIWTENSPDLICKKCYQHLTCQSKYNCKHWWTQWQSNGAWFTLVLSLLRCPESVRPVHNVDILYISINQL